MDRTVDAPLNLIGAPLSAKFFIAPFVVYLVFIITEYSEVRKSMYLPKENQYVLKRAQSLTFFLRRMPGRAELLVQVSPMTTYVCCIELFHLKTNSDFS